MICLTFKKFAPSDKLKPYIQTYWLIKNPTKRPITLPIVPDGCMDIIYKNNQLFLVGSMSKSIRVETKSNDISFGIRFTPTILPSLINQSAKDFVDKVVPLQVVSPKLHKLLNFQTNHKDKVIKLNTIFENLFSFISYDTQLYRIASHIRAKKGNITIGELMSEYDIHPKKLYRLFEYSVGYSPKKFANIIRFFFTFKSLIKERQNEYVDTALHHGYYDQAHFNKEFKKFTNFTPTQLKYSPFFTIQTYNN